MRRPTIVEETINDSFFTINKDNIKDLYSNLSSEDSQSLEINFIRNDELLWNELTPEEILENRVSKLKFTKQIKTTSKFLVNDMFFKVIDNTLVQNFITNLFKSCITKAEVVIL
jgi:hypothetical protein